MNREIYPFALYPLTGDVTSTPGNASVTVTGLMNVPITSAFLNGGERMAYNAATHNWMPTLRSTVSVNSVVVSDDDRVLVNVAKNVLVNGA